MVKQDVVIGVYRRAETKTGLSFELALSSMEFLPVFV